VFLPALLAMSEIPSLFAQRPIIQRHRNAAMYHPFVEAVALTLVDVPVTFITIALYSIVLYFLVGLQRTAGQFLCVIPSFPTLSLKFYDSIFFLIQFSTALLSKSLFRSLAAAFKAEAPAQAFAGIMILVVALYSRYLAESSQSFTNSSQLGTSYHNHP
jgi:ATP-binding cassette subfamily G (WHITE) protein 2 (SNQ2)